MNPDRSTEVLVVGAGPVGLFTALCLAESGVAVEVIDKYHRAASHSYALALHPRTLRLLNEFGLADTLIGLGQKVGRVVLHQGEARLAELNLSTLEAPFNFVLVLPQSLLEAALERGLRDRGVRVVWNHPVLTFDSDPRGVHAIVAKTREVRGGYPVVRSERTEVSTLPIRSSFLVGADGYLSLTRRMLGVDYEDLGGLTGYGLIEFTAPLRARDQVDLVFHDGSTDVLWPVGPDRGRWSVQLPDLEEHRDIDTLRGMIRSRAPWFDFDFGEVHWMATVCFDRRLAKRFGDGRVWLAGDAAHLTLPAGAQSMNIGLQEAYDLAERMTAILREGRPVSVLRDYDRERREEWKRLLGLDGGLHPLPGAPKWSKALAGRLLSSLPATGDDLGRLLEQVGLRFSRPRCRRGSSSVASIGESC